ncbi:MAG: NYN domain-containing protein [Promethearchaeota archaeon]
MEPRIMIFIDNSNIFQGFKKYKIKADYEKLKNKISKDRQLHGIFLYEGVLYPITPKKKKWYGDLSNKSGYVIKTSFNKMSHQEFVEKKIDIQIAIDIISGAYENAFDTAVLVSGDGDFLPVAQKINELDKSLEIWAFKYSLANTLKEEVGLEKIYYLDDILSEIKM